MLRRLTSSKSNGGWRYALLCVQSAVRTMPPSPSCTREVSRMRAAGIWRRDLLHVLRCSPADSAERFFEFAKRVCFVPCVRANEMNSDGSENKCPWGEQFGAEPIEKGSR